MKVRKRRNKLYLFLTGRDFKSIVVIFNLYVDFTVDKKLVNKLLLMAVFFYTAFNILLPN